MTVLFMGGEMSAFTPSDSSVVEFTGSGFFNANFCRCAITCPIDTNYAEGLPSASATDIWIHFDLLSPEFPSATATVRFIWYDSSGNERVRIKYADSSTNIITVEYWTGAWTSAGTVNVDISQLQTMDLHVIANSATGTVALYVAGTERLNATVDTSSITNLKKFRFYGGNVLGIALSTNFSQVVVSDESTIGQRLFTRYVNGAGATSSWTGAYTDIDEVVYSDADFILSATNNQVSTFSQTGPVLTGYVPRAVCVSARAKRGASGPQNIRMALRSAGTDYFSGSDIALGAGYTPLQTIWETNPATSADFLASAIDALQPGVKSIA